MPQIKTRDVLKGTVKAIDKSAVAGQRMKDAYVRVKDKAEQSYYSAENSPEEYATDRVSTLSGSALHEVGHQFDKRGRKAVSETKDNISKAKEYFKQKKAEQTVQKAREQAKQAVRSLRKAPGTGPGTISGGSIQAGSGSGRTAGRVTHRENVLIRMRGENTLAICQSSRSAGNTAVNTLKRSAKEAGRSVKTAEQASKTAIKTGQQAAKSAQATAKTAQKTARAARAAAQKAAKAAKQKAQAAARAVRAILAGIKALISAILAGGWIAAVVVIIICMIGLLLGSSYGIFFSGEDSGTGMTMRAVIREINVEYNNRLEEIKNTVSHDELEMSGSRAAWKEVLAVYAVKTTTAAEEAQDVSVMDEGRKQLLEALFWDMNEVSYHTETETHTETTETDDGNGNTVTEETEVTITRLCITVSHKTAEEMAKQLHFDARQVKQLKELLLPKNDSLWANVLYGIAGGDGEIVSVALSQLGNVGGEPYWSWYGFSGRVEWCACFVSWCANECGYIDAGVIPKFAGCVPGSEWFKEHGQWEERDFIPDAGQIIFFDWEGDGETDHVGIVESCEDGVVCTVEGNSGDACRQREYAVGSRYIYGYGLPAY